MNNGIKLEEIKRLFNYLEENKTNDNLQIIMTTEGCHALYKLFINFNNYLKISEEKINKIEEMFNDETLNKYYHGMSYEFEINEFKKDIFKILKGEKNDR